MTDRQSLILKYWPLAKAIAYNTCFFSHLKEECQSIATEVMINAIDNYDPAKKASLKTWIVKNVKFAVIDFIRQELSISDNTMSIDSFYFSGIKKGFSSSSSQDISESNVDWESFHTSYSKNINHIYEQFSTNGLEDRINARDLLFKFFYYIDRCKGNRRRKDECEVLLAYFFDGQLMREIAEWRGCKVPNISLTISQLRQVIIDEFGLIF